MAYRKYTDETKAAVTAALLTGQSISQVAKEYEIPEGTVRGWKQRYEKPLEKHVHPKKEKKGEIGDLLVLYLETNLKALQAQAEAFSNPTWLSNQEAGQAAILHGVMTDKAVRLLEALSKSGADDD